MNAADPLAGAVFVLGAWWASTAAVLALVFRRTGVALVSVLAVAGVFGLWSSSRSAGTGAAYVAFASALLVWAWHELMFLLGVIAGPRRVAMTAGVKGWARFREATLAVLHHELSLAVTLAAVVALTWGQPNQAGTGTFAVLWVMRLAAKLNVFTGVRNFNDELVPEHLRYLSSYFRRARWNPMLLATIAVSGVAGVWLWRDARGVGQVMVATLLGLGVLEHVFLAVPLPDAALWRWVTRTEAP
ncbi:MAG: DUF3623 domain-containing protein [Myxococcaceae bacterium]|nr:DUF3623 domain-containing protein [Myxococcaceae bacterium]